MTSYWGRVDERLIRRGEIILDLRFVRSYSDELRELNYGKRGGHTG
ncbi:hypothetical protein HRbin02_01577 [Candidatus Calditenuaceae archaeon HR02]|nr:hypothetical protein HRbin02_01577 [Candidatus Calditenuaceae archaeon HR02]